MKTFNFLSKLCRLSRASQYYDVGIDRRFTVGSPSVLYFSAHSARAARRWLKSVAVFLFLFTLTIGQMRAGTYSFDLHTVASKSAGSDVSYWYSNSTCTTHCKTVDGSSNKISSCTLYYKDATITTAKPFVISVANDAYWFTGSPSKFFIGKSGSTITLPTFSGEKITNVRITTGAASSTKVTFCIKSGSYNASTNTSQTGAASTSFDFPIISTYQSTALTFTITNAYNINITDIIITTEAAASCTTSPTVTASSNGSVTATTATVTCSLGISSLGSAGCSISSYGFVIGGSANPEIGGSGVTQHQVGTTYTTTGTSFYKDLTGLSPETTYYVRAYATNGNGTAYGSQTYFTTEAKGCTDHNGTNVVSGSETSGMYGPVYPYYEYSTRQILYTKTDLGLAAGKKGTIKSIYFQYAYASAMTGTNTVKIYMANTNLSALSTSNYLTSFTEVYSGALNCKDGWNEITLTTPFDYNGLGNLVVVIDDNSNKDEGSSAVFKYHEASTTTGAQLYTHAVSTNADPTAAATWTGATATNYRPNTKFCIQEADMTPATVTLMDNSATLTEASVGAGVTLPTRTGCTEYTFAGWTKSWVAEQDEWTTTAPTIIPAGSYYPSSNENLYPVYTKSEGEYVSVTGGDMSSGLTTGWYTATAGTYSSGNGVKFDDEGDWILSDDFSSENLTKVTVKFKAGNDGAAGSILRFEAIDEAGYEITGVDFSPTDTYDGQSTVNTVVIDASEKIYTVAVELTSKTNNVGMKYCEVFKGGPTISYISVPDCCDKNITIGDPIITGSGDVTFTYGGDAISAGDVVETCKAAQEVVATVTPEMGYECTSLTFSGGSVSVSPTPGSGNYPAYPSTYDYTLSFDKNTTSATLSTSATFAAKSVTGWTWKQELADASEITIPSTVELYVGQQARFNLKSYTPDVIEDNKGYSASYTSADLAQDSKAGAYYVTRAKIVKESTTLTLTSTNNALVQQVITIRIKALPLVHFVDKIHGVEFADVVANVDATEKRTVYTTKPTPTHSDVSDPGSNYNSCEQQHLHLVGWILSTWADANPGATHLQIIGAGSGTYYAAGADIDVEAQNTKTFYAVWGHEGAE